MYFLQFSTCDLLGQPIDLKTCVTLGFGAVCMSAIGMVDASYWLGVHASYWKKQNEFSQYLFVFSGRIYSVELTGAVCII